MKPQHAAGRPGVSRTPGRPAQPPRPAGYWERVQRIVDTAPPLSDEQRARIRVALHGGRRTRAGAAA